MFKLILKDLFSKRLDAFETTQAKISLSLVQKRGGRIIWFSAPSEGDALAEITRELMSFFEKESTGIFEINLAKADPMIALAEASKEPVWFAFSPFGVGQ